MSLLRKDTGLQKVDTRRAGGFCENREIGKFVAHDGLAPPLDIIYPMLTIYNFLAYTGSE